MKKKTRVVLIVALIVITGAYVLSSYLAFKSQVISGDFKTFAEKKFGELLNADISVNKIKVGLLKYVTLSGLKIDRRLSKGLVYLVDVKEIVFRYNPFSFLNIDTLTPNRIELQTPRIEFSKFTIPHALFLKKIFRSSPGRLLLEISNGEIGYILPALKTKFLFTNINGQIIPQGFDSIKLDFKGRGAGDVHGGIALSGEYITKDKTCDLVLTFDDLEVTSSSFIPIVGLNGKAHITEDVITLKDIIFFVRGVPVRVMGEIRDYSEDNPKLNLTFIIDTKHVQSTFTFYGPSDDLKMKGNFNLARYAYEFVGDVLLKEEGFRVRHMRINDTYDAEGDFLFNEGIYSFLFKKGKQEVRCSFVHDNYEISLDISLNHVTFLGYDFVTVGQLQFEPDIAFWRDGILKLNGSLKTDYMIFNYKPLKDFSGTFTFEPGRLSNMTFKWGNVYEMVGNLTYEDPKTVNIEVIVDGLDLANSDSFGGIMIPDNIEGEVYGRVNIEGAAENPAIEGYINTSEGRFNAFKFKKVSIHFRGDRYFLSLYDSKLYRSDSVFYLRGAIDFTKKNVFHDLLLESSEKLILWRGWDLSKNEIDDKISLKKSLSDNVNFNVEGAFRSDEQDDRTQRESEVSLEYNYQNDQSIRISFEEDVEDEIISLKHQIRF